MTEATELEQRVLSSRPEQLRLILIEEAIRSARETVENWKQHKNELGLQNVARCRRIVNELLNGIRADGTLLSRQVSSLYLHLFQYLVEAQQHRDIPKLEQVIQVLEVEEGTWRLVCQANEPNKRTAENGKRLSQQFAAESLNPDALNIGPLPDSKSDSTPQKIDFQA